MEPGQNFFTAKNLLFLNKQIKAMYLRRYWPELDEELPSIARTWLQNFTNYRISDDLRVMNSDFIKWMANYYYVEIRDPENAVLDKVYNPSEQKRNRKYAGEFMYSKDPFLEYQSTKLGPIEADNRVKEKSSNLFGDMTLGNMPVFWMLNDEEKYFLNSAFDIGAKSGRRTNRVTKEQRILERPLKDSLIKGKPRTFYKVNAQNIDQYDHDENEFFDKYDPVGPGTVYDCGGVVTRKYTKDATPYNVAGVDLRYKYHDGPTTTIYAGSSAYT